jgi:hypothetical protein
MRFALGLLVLPLCGCHSLQDLDIQYEECVEEKQVSYREEFGEDGIRPLRDKHCWKSDNEGATPLGLDSKLFVEDGDLVMRVDNSGTTDLDQWTPTDQAPMFFRRLDGDFLVVVRAEAATIVEGDHCLNGEYAGLVVRQSDDPSIWSTWTVEPDLETFGNACADGDNPPARVRIRSSNPAFETRDLKDVGSDGEADIAICRVGGKVYYYYGEATAVPTKDEWVQVESTVSDGPVFHPLGAGVVDVGVTVAGVTVAGAKGIESHFDVAGHFNWIVFQEGTYGDGCTGALEDFVLPEDL